jgi:hypothetical protein
MKTSKDKIKEVEEGLRKSGAIPASIYYATEYLYRLADKGKFWFMGKTTKELVDFFNREFEIGLKKFLENRK